MQDAAISFSLVDRRFIYASPSVETVLGYPLQRFVDEPELFKQIIHPGGLECALEAREKARREGFAEIEHRLIWPDGQVRWVYHRAWANRNDQDHPVHMNEVFRDVTDQKHVEAALQESELIYRLTSSCATWSCRKWMDTACCLRCVRIRL